MKQLPESLKKWLLNQMTKSDWESGKQFAENNLHNGVMMILQSYPLLEMADKQLSDISSKTFVDKLKDKAKDIKEIFKSKEDKDAERYAAIIADKIEDYKINNDTTGPVAERSIGNTGQPMSEVGAAGGQVNSNSNQSQ